MKYAYFPGCSLESTAKEYDLSLRTVFQTLNIGLTEIPEWICCGSTPSHLVNRHLAVALPIASLLWPEKENLDVIAPCASCFSRLRLSNTEVQDNPRLLKEVNELIGANYQGKVRVLSMVELLGETSVRTSIAAQVKQKLTGLKVACYYGCLLTRPRKLNVPHWENPILMDEICSLLGAEPIDWSGKTECCGANFSLSNQAIAFKLIYDILDTAKQSGAECVIVACPLCQSNLDLRQQMIEKQFHTELNLPIIYITQLIGLALNLPLARLGIDKLVVSPVDLWKRKELIK